MGTNRTISQCWQGLPGYQPVPFANAYLFESLEQVRVLADKWVDEYNELHPYKSYKWKNA